MLWRSKLKITFAEFFKGFKKYINSEVIKMKNITSDSDKLNYLFELLIKAKNIKNKNGDLLYLDKSRCSLILSNKTNVPVLISSEYSYLKTNADIRKEYILFFKKCISSLNVEELLNLLGEKGSDKYAVLYDCFVESLITNNIRNNELSILLYENGINTVRLVQGDIFDYCFKRNSEKNIIMIPVNTNFDVHVSTKLEMNPLVSSETLHGQWVQRCRNSGFSEKQIQNKIQTFLKKQHNEEFLNGAYQIGTIVPFDTKRGITYLIAISQFDENNNAHSNKEDMEKAIKKLIEFYDHNGQGYSLYIPLIGTGRSRADLSFQQAFELIKGTLLNNKEHIQGTIKIIALPTVYEKIKERSKKYEAH